MIWRRAVALMALGLLVPAASLAAPTPGPGPTPTPAPPPPPTPDYRTTLVGLLQTVDISSCKNASFPNAHGQGRIDIELKPNGSVQSAKVASPGPFANVRARK